MIQVIFALVLYLPSLALIIGLDSLSATATPYGISIQVRVDAVFNSARDLIFIKHIMII